MPLELTRVAALLLEALPDDERERITDWAGRIARAHGHTMIGVDDIKAACRCVGPEFLPGEGEYTDDQNDSD